MRCYLIILGLCVVGVTMSARRGDVERSGNQNERIVCGYSVAGLIHDPGKFETDVVDVGTMSPPETFMKLVEDTVDPNSWRDNGGSVGEAHVVGDELLVIQTRWNQRLVALLIQQVREASGKIPYDRAPDLGAFTAP